MKAFKSTGRGPKYGNFSFPSKAGFGPSSGHVKNVSGYSRRAPKKVMKKAIGGLAEDNIVEAPGFSDFAKGGKVSFLKKGDKALLPKKLTGFDKDHIGIVLKTDTLGDNAEVSVGKHRARVKSKDTKNPGMKLGGKAKSRMGYAEGGKVSAEKAKQIAQGVVKSHVNYPAPKGHKGFSRTPKIGK